jgi:hypothetical protein
MAHKFDTTLTGAAGEHLVLSRLLYRGLVAAQAPEGVRKVDILVTPKLDNIQRLIQVKSRRYGSDGGWHMSKKHEDEKDPNLFYCFVDFEPEKPDVYVIPSAIVADAIKYDHALWLNTPGLKGQKRKDTNMRRLRPKMPSLEEGWIEKYLERWELLES